MRHAGRRDAGRRDGVDASRHRAADTSWRCGRDGRRVPVGEVRTPMAARQQALAGREYVEATWSRGPGVRVDCRALEERVADLRDAVSGGHYAQKQILSRDKLVAWSHARRFATALTLARSFAGKRILDYGSGDGTFLALAMMADSPPAAAVGAELLDDVIEDCQRAIRRRAAHELRAGRVARRVPSTRSDTTPSSAWKCSSTCSTGSPSWRGWRGCSRPAARSSSACRSRPGLPVLVKQIVRTIAGWRKIGHYPGHDVLLVERARSGRVRRSHAACAAAGLRFRRRSRARSQRLQLAGAARAPEASSSM